MLILRIIAAALAVLLVGVMLVAPDARRDVAKPVLMYEKGVYLGKPDTAPSAETRDMIRARTNEQKP
jgi:hypothetical protein